jgi:hypothetical protein
MRPSRFAAIFFAAGFVLLVAHLLASQSQVADASDSATVTPVAQQSQLGPQRSLAPVQGTPQNPYGGVAAISPRHNAAGQAIPLTRNDVVSYALANSLPRAIGPQSAPTVHRADLLTAAEVKALLPYTDGMPPTVWYVELTGPYTFPSPPTIPSVTFPYGLEVFDAQTGNLLLVGGSYS